MAKTDVKESVVKDLVTKALTEISTSRLHKQKRVKHWQKNEDMYYGKKVFTDTARANVDIGKMQGYVHTFMSKIDNPLTFKFKKRKEADLKSVKKVNALKDQDSNDDDWNIKDIVGKKQMAMYGRAVFAYFASSVDGEYKPNLEPVDVYDFLIDPKAGGLDIEKARFMGRFNVTLDRTQIEAGIDKGYYIKKAAKELLKSGGQSTSAIGQTENTNKQNRETIEGGVSKESTTSPDDDEFYFWEWFTTYKGDRYYMLMTDAGLCIRAEKLETMFPKTTKFPHGPWPFWTYAAYPDLTEFWTPGPCDVVREIFTAQGLSINQMIDLAELIIDPMKVVNISKLVNKAHLKTRPGGVIETKDNTRVEDILQFVKFADIQTPKILYDTLDAISQSESGVTGGMRGLSEEDKVSIYEGNQANAADRFGFVNKSYAQGYKRMSYLWLYGAQMNLKKKKAVDMIGGDGVEIVEITRKDLKGFAEFVPVVESSDAESMSDAKDRKQKFDFLAGLKGDHTYNQKKITEMQAALVGFTADDIREILDPETYGSQDLMSEAARDIEMLVLGKDVKPNLNANMAYMKKIIDWTKDHYEQMTPELVMAFDTYIQALDAVVTYNTTRAMLNKVADEQLAGRIGGAVGNAMDAGDTDPALQQIQNDMPQPEQVVQ